MFLQENPMSLFSKNDHLKEHKEKKKREIRPYKPPRPLSAFSARLVILLGAVLLCYAASFLTLRFAGVEIAAAANTRLDESGAVAAVPVTGVTTTLYYTYRDGAGTLRGGMSSLFGNTGPIGDTVAIRYFPAIPGWSMPSFQTQQMTVPFGCLLLGVILIYTGVARLREIKKGREEASE